jgi:hypothetical protein
MADENTRDQTALQSIEFLETKNGEKVVYQDKNGNLTLITEMFGNRPEQKLDLTLEEILDLADGIRLQAEVQNLFS